MAKVIAVGNVTQGGSLGTSSKWYKASNVELLANSGKTDIRIDKAMIQVSSVCSTTASIVVGYIVHLTDETGADLAGSITAGTTDDAALTTLLNQWKDNVFMTDFRIIGPTAAPIYPLISLEANTRRVLKPGQKLYLTFIMQPRQAETSKDATMYYDSIVWYSAAAQ